MGANFDHAHPGNNFIGTRRRTYTGLNRQMTTEKDSKIKHIRNFSIIAHIDN